MFKRKREILAKLYGNNQGGTSSQSILDGAPFLAELTHTAVPQRAAPGTTATFTRATPKTVENNDGYLVTLLAGEIGFPGARRVRNFFTYSEDFSNAVWTKSGATVTSGFTDPDGGTTAWRFLCSTNTGYLEQVVAGIPLSNSTVQSWYIKSNTGASQDVRIARNVDIDVVTVTTEWQRFEQLSPSGGGTGFYLQDPNNASRVDVLIWHPQLEDVTAQTTQTAGEYVSVGALDYRSELNRLYLSLPGTASHYASSPDSVAASITGDLTLEWVGNISNYGIINTLISKWNVASYLLRISATKKVLFDANGTNSVSITSTASVPFNAGDDNVGVKVVVDADNGAGGSTTSIYTTTNGGDTWTLLEAATVTAGVLSIADTTDVVMVGSYGTGAAGQLAGRTYSAKIYSGSILALDFNPHRDATTPTGTITSSTTGEVWTINGASSVVRSDYYHGSFVDGIKCFPTDLAGNALPTQYTYDAVSLNGVAGTYVSTPDSVANSITGDIDIRVKAALVDWTPSAIQVLVAKDNAAASRCFVFYVNTSGKLEFTFSINGLAYTRLATSSVAVGATDGATTYVRMTYASATGKVNFYTSADGVTWSLLGTEQTVAAGSIFDGTAVLELGSYQTGTIGLTSGKIYHAQIYNGINGTLAVDFDASRYAGGTTLTGSTGETWTLQGNAVIHPTNNPMRGYIAEGARTNLCLQSNAFGTAPWTDYSGTLTIVQDAIGPDGATSAWTATDDGGAEGRFQSNNLTNASVYTCSIFVGKTTGAPASYPSLEIETGTSVWGCCINTTAGTATAITTYSTLTPIAPSAIRVNSFNDDFWRVEFTFTATATATYLFSWLAAFNLTGTGTLNSAATGSAVFYGAQLELGSFASSYIATTTAAVTRAADVDSVPTASNILAAASTVCLEFTPDHTPSGTIALWGTYVDASNYTAILHDATNMIMRKRIAGVNYDATIANAFSANTTYKVCGSWGAAGTSIALDGTLGTGHANTTAAQVAATMQFGADGNSLQQPFASVGAGYIGQRQLSASELQAITR